MAKAPKKTQVEEAVNTAVEEKAVNLSVSDLAAAVQIIDFAAGRGAFTGENLSKVGQVRDRLAEVVQALTPPAEEAASADAE